MGTGQSNLECFYQAQERLGGGKCCKVGGADDLLGYMDSLGSTAKRHLIKQIAKAVRDAGLKELGDVDKMSVEEIIKALKDKIPNPRENRKTWSSKEESQTPACKIIAGAINKTIGQTIINLNDSAEKICDDVSEVMYSLFTGLHAELLLIKEDTSRILKNIRVLEEFLDRTYRAMITKIDAATDSSLSAETKVLQETHEDITIELKRQQKMLEILLDNVIKTDDIDIASLLKETKDFKHLVQKIKARPGGPKFGEKIAYTLGILGSTAAIAGIVDKALKTAGMNYKEYAEAKDFKSLMNRLSQSLQGKLGESESALRDYTKAMDTLAKYYYNRDDVVKHLEGKIGKYEANQMFSNYAQDMQQFIGGLESVTGGLKLDKVIKSRADLKKNLLRAFNQRLGNLINNALSAARKIGDAIKAGTIALTDSLDKFVKALEEIPDIQRKFTYFALSGYYEHIQATQDREQFIGHVRYMLSTIDKLLGESVQSSGDFKDLKLAFGEIIKLIEDYSTKFAEGFGTILPKQGRQEDFEGGEGITGYLEKAKKVTEKIPGAIQQFGKSVGEIGKSVGEIGKEIGKIGKGEDDYSGAEEAIEGGTEDILPEVARIAYDFNRVRDIVRYHMRTAKVLENLKTFSGEVKAYGEDYVKILADAVAGAVDNAVLEKNRYVGAGFEKSTGIADPTRHVLRDLYLVYTKGDVNLNAVGWANRETANNLPNDLLFAGKAKFQKVLEFLAKVFDAKIELFRIAEAMDLYMKAFADGIASSPDDIRDLIQILSTTEVISKWFTEKSGDYICNVFDTFPSAFYGQVPVYSNLPQAYNRMSQYHYFIRVGVVCGLIDINRTHALDQDLGIGGIANHVALNAHFGTTPADRISYPMLPDTYQRSYFGMPGNPYLGLPIESDDENNALKVVKYMEKAMSISVLKNIVSMFINIGRKFGGKELDNQIHMSPIQIYRGLMNYLTYSSFAFALKNPTGAIHQRMKDDLPIVFFPDHHGDAKWLQSLYDTGTSGYRMDSIMCQASGVDFTNANGRLTKPPAVTAPLPARVVPVTGVLPDIEQERRRNTVVMRDSVAKVNNIYNDIFTGPCDNIFQMIMKSMVAKVFTTIGTYNLLHRPIHKSGLYGYQQPFRFILGGVENPKVIPEALELYIRLPLLAEFYREIFRFDSNVSSITMVPEFDGVFSGLVNLVFDKAKYVKHGEYSETDVRIIIEEVNKIYTKFKAGNNPVRDAIHEFVAEVNRRYGILKQEERERYLKEQRARYKSTYVAPEESVEFELHGLDESETTRRPSPSDSYRTVGLTTATGSSGIRHKHKIDLETDLGYVASLRTAIDNLFRVGVGNDLLAIDNNTELQEHIKEKVSFTGIVRARSEELKNAKDEKERFDIIHAVINSLGEFAISSLEKSIIAFHELVVFPLNTLFGVAKTLTEFQRKIDTIITAMDTLGVEKDDPSYSGSWIARLETAVVQPQILNAAANVLIGDPDIHAKLYPYLHKIGSTGYNVGYSPTGVLSINMAAANLPDYRLDAIPAWMSLIRVNTQGLNGSRVGPIPTGLLYYTYDHLNDLFRSIVLYGGADRDASYKKALDVMRRFLLDQDRILLTLFESIFSHSSAFDDLITVKIDVQKAQSVTNPGARGIDTGDTCKINCFIDHSNLFQVVTNTFMTLKQNIDRFRGILPKKIITKYESLQTGSPASDNVGSVYWIEKHLIVDIISGKSDEVSGEFKPIDMINTKIKKIFNFLTKSWNVNGNDLLTGAPPAVGAIPNRFGQPYRADLPVVGARMFNITLDSTPGVEIRSGVSFHEFTNMLQRLVFYDPTTVYYDFPPDRERLIDLTHCTYGNNSNITYGNIRPERTEKNIEWLLFNTSGRRRNGVDDKLPLPGVPHFRLNYLYDQYIPSGAITIPGIAPGNPGNDPATVGKFTSGMEHHDNYRSVMITFNRLIAAYIHMAFDHTSKKIYATTLAKFANGAFSSSVMGDKNFMDSVLEPTNDPMGVPNKYEGVLFRTLALAMRHLYTAIDDKGVKKQYLETDLNEMPLFVKERYKASLPVFCKLFTILNKRCEILKHLVRGLNVARDVSLDYFMIQPNLMHYDGYATSNIGNTNVARDVNEKYMIAVLDQIIIGCTAMIQCAKDTLTELNDNPKFAEFYDGSIQTYENTNSVAQFMPISTLAYLYKPLGVGQNVIQHLDETRVIFPEHDPGVNAFKLLYATRKVLCSDIGSLDDIPGVKEILKQYNFSTDPSHHVDDKTALQYMQGILKISRGLVNLTHYVPWFITYITRSMANHPRAIVTAGLDRASAASLVNSRRATVNTLSPSHCHLSMVAEYPDDQNVIRGTTTYQLRHFNPYTSLADTTTVIDSTSQKEQKSKIIDTVEAREGCPERNTRKSMIVHNIMDLNIVPISVHALMREIPMINLINYSNAFDSMVRDIMHVELRQNDISTNTFVNLTTNPYRDISWKAYESVGNFIRGNVGISGMGRPKYIGDEVFNKSLLNELYMHGPMEPGGPAIDTGKDNELRAISGRIMNDIASGEFMRMITTNIVGSFIQTLLNGPYIDANGFLPRVGTEELLEGITRTPYLFYNVPVLPAVIVPRAWGAIRLYPNQATNNPIMLAPRFPPAHAAAAAAAGLANDNIAMFAYDDPAALAAASGFWVLPTPTDGATYPYQYPGYIRKLDDAMKLDVYELCMIIAAQLINDRGELSGAYNGSHIQNAVDAVRDTYFGPGNQWRRHCGVAKFMRYSLTLGVWGPNPNADRDEEQLYTTLSTYIIFLIYAMYDGSVLKSVQDTVVKLALAHEKIGFDNSRSIRGSQFVTANATALEPIMTTFLSVCEGINIAAIDLLAAPAVRWRNLFNVGNIPNVVSTYRTHPSLLDHLNRVVTDNNFGNIIRLGTLAALPYIANTADRARFYLGEMGPIFAVFVDSVLVRIHENHGELSSKSNAIVEAYLKGGANLNQLSYLVTKDGSTHIKKIALNNEIIHKLTLQSLGAVRFDTVFVRNIFWLTNLQRIMRLKLRRDLSWHDEKVVRDLAVTAPEITEQFGNSIADGPVIDGRF